jgi:hypothetical protein
VLLDFWSFFVTLTENNTNTNSLEPIKMQKNFYLQILILFKIVLAEKRDSEI